MKPIRATLPRFRPMHGWANRILRVDLSAGRIWAQETAPYLPDFLGGRGLAARLLWDEVPAPVDPFDPRSPLMVFPGILTGTRATDERVLSRFEYDENWVNPLLGRRMRLERDRFAPLLDEYYRLRGWDIESGWPTPETLDRLDIGWVHDDMVAGAAAAAERLPSLPPELPVHDHHRLDPERAGQEA